MFRIKVHHTRNKIPPEPQVPGVFITYYGKLLSLGHFSFLAVAIFCSAAKLFLNAEKLVVLGHTVGAACRTSLDLTGVCSNCDISDSSILSFT